MFRPEKGYGNQPSGRLRLAFEIVHKTLGHCVIWVAVAACVTGVNLASYYLFIADTEPYFISIIIPSVLYGVAILCFIVKKIIDSKARKHSNIESSESM